MNELTVIHICPLRQETYFTGKKVLLRNLLQHMGVEFIKYIRCLTHSFKEVEISYNGV